MKVSLVFTLAVAGWLAAGPRFVLAQATEEEVLPPTSSAQPVFAPSVAAGAKTEFRHWHQGEPPLRLIRQDEGFCALTSVGGSFAGGAEGVSVYVGDDGYWYLGGKSQQHGVDAQCVVVRYPGTSPKQTRRARRIKILAASFGAGSRSAEVTARVRDLLRDGKMFRVDPDVLQTEPASGWRKTLVIFYKVGGKSAVCSTGEGEFINDKFLADDARLIPDKLPMKANAGDLSSLLPASEVSPGSTAQLRRAPSMDVAEQIEDQNDQENRAQTAARPVAPTTAVAPGGERPEK